MRRHYKLWAGPRSQVAWNSCFKIHGRSHSTFVVVGDSLTCCLQRVDNLFLLSVLRAPVSRLLTKVPDDALRNENPRPSRGADGTFSAGDEQPSKLTTGAR